MISRVQIWLATAPNLAVAESIAKTLVEKNIVACVNIVPQLTSIYRWQGQIETSAECLLIIKTAKERAAELKTAFKAAHPYDVPELIAIEVVDGLPDYLNWVLGA